MRAILYLLLAAAALVPAARAEISFVHVRLAGGKLEVLSHSVRPGTLKHSPPRGAASWELLLEDGSIAAEGSLMDEERIEFPMENGEIGATHAPASEWVLRAPGSPAARKLRLKLSGAGLLRQGVTTPAVLEASVPAPAPRLRPQVVESKLITLLTNGPSGNRLNAVILAEGFRANEETRFLTNAAAVLEKLLGTPPYAALRSFFNGYAIFVPSNESGADRPSMGVFRDTYFSASFESSGLDRLLTIPPNSFNPNFAEGRGKAFALLQQHVPDYDFAMMLVNDETYGGSGGTPALASLNRASADIMIHELGHSFAGLGDEYESPANYPDVEEPNTTRETRRAFIKWNAWIDAATPIPTPPTAANSRLVGLFEGAHYHATGWYRPKLNCAMRTLGVPFCEVCSETLILASYARVNMLEAVSPAPGALASTRESPVRILFVPVPGMSKDVAISWRVNGRELAANGPLDFAHIYSSTGVHQVQLEARDTTEAVRVDPSGHLAERSAWMVNVASSGAPAVSGTIQHANQAAQVSYASTHLATLILENTVDFSVWTPVLTNEASTSVEFPIPGGIPNASFFRVRALPAF